MVTLRKVLVTTDLSEYSLAALEYASTLSLLYSARLFVLHVEDIVPPPMYAVHIPDFEGEQFQQQVFQQAHRDLEAFARLRISPDLNATLVVRVGKTVDEIIRFVEQEGIDIIVMATHGRTGLKHVLMGSVAERVVRTSPVPVLSVKPRPIREGVISTEDIERELHMR